MKRDDRIERYLNDIKERESIFKGKLKAGDKLVIKTGWPVREKIVEVDKPYSSLGGMNSYTIKHEGPPLHASFADIVRKL